MKTLNNLMKYIPLGSTFIIFLSYMKNSIYYSQFNIDIISYIGLSEFITLFLKDSYLILLILAITYPILVVIKNLTKFFEFIKKFKYYLILLISITLILITIFIVKGTIKNLNNDASGFELATLIISIVFMFLSIVVLLIIENTNISKKFQLIASMVITFLFIISSAIYSAYKIKNANKNFVYDLKMEDRTISTNNNLVKVGKTENYIFLYNKIKKTTWVIKTENIDEIIIHPRNK